MGQGGRRSLCFIYFLKDYLCVCVCVYIIFKVCIEFVTILSLFNVLVFWPQEMWALSCLTRD